MTGGYFYPPQCTVSLQWQEKCEAGQEVLDEQLAYINYMDTEYDTRQWKATDDIISVNADDDHTAIKNKLDTEVPLPTTFSLLLF